MGEVGNPSGNQSGSDASETDKLNQERQKIVIRYTKGIGCDDESDKLGDPEFTDQYGFVLKAVPLPLPKQEEERRRQNEVKRRMKWLKMVRHWDKYSGTEKLFKRVYKGIPQSMRGDVWKLLLQVYQYMDNMPAVYKEMKTRAHSHSTDIRQIDLDVNRTYRDHEMFRRRYSIKQQELFHVLAAYSMYNTEVGYCQGMSQIAALLLMYMSEEEAFWALHSLLYGERHKMHGFFIPGFPKLIRFQEHHDRVLKKLMPKLKKHFDENEVFASLYTMKWFFQCFLDRSPFSLTLRLWDIYVLEGEKLLVAMSYATLKLHKAYLKNQDMDGIVSFLQEQLVKDFGAPNDSVVEHLKDCMVELHRYHMDLPPKAHSMENPKLPFGEFIPTDDMSQAKVPDFAKHAVDIGTLLPGFKRNGSFKKKRDKVKRGKSEVGKSPTPNGIDRTPKLPIIKETKLEEEHLNRSPFLRGSKKFAKTERAKATESPHLNKSTPKATPKKKTESKETTRHKHISKASGHPTVESDSPSSEQTEEHLVSNTRISPYTPQSLNGDHHVHIKQGKGHNALLSRPTNSEHDSDSTAANYSYHSNNSNNSKTNGKAKNPSHRYSSEKFVPPILSRVSSSSYDTHSSDGNSSPAKRPPSMQWNIPSSAKNKTKNSYNTIQPRTSGNYHSSGTAPKPYHSLAPYSQTMARKKSQSSDLLKETSGPALKSKTLSFSQLSAALDTIDNASLLNSPISSTPSDTGSSAVTRTRKSPSARPMSYYDNVPTVAYGNEDFTAPVGGSKSAKGVEDFARTKSRKVRSKKNMVSSKSMGDLPKAGGGKHRIKNGTRNKSNHTPVGRQEQKDDVPKSVEEKVTHLAEASPFQKAILENGILDPPMSVTRGRRMSREEAVTAAVLSQMESKSRRGYPIRKPQRRNAKLDNSSSMKKSKSAVSLEHHSRYADLHNVRKMSVEREQVILPQISSNYTSQVGHQVKDSSMRKNLSTDALVRSAERPWGTTELDTVGVDSASFDSTPVHPVQSLPSDNGASLNFAPFGQPASHFVRHPSANYAINPKNTNLMYVPQLPQSGNIMGFNVIPPNSEINRLLSSGINADSSILRKHDGFYSRAEQNLFGPNSKNRRHSVNMAVQTEESRVS